MVKKKLEYLVITYDRNSGNLYVHKRNKSSTRELLKDAKTWGWYDFSGEMHVSDEEVLLIIPNIFFERVIEKIDSITRFLKAIHADNEAKTLLGVLDEVDEGG